MPDDNFPNKNDALLLPFLLAEADAEDCLNRLFEEIVIPQIRKTLSSYLTLLFDEKDEIQSDAQARVLSKLRSLREIAATKPIENLAAYISSVAFNCRKDFILAKQPEWRRIDYRLKRLRDENDSDWRFFTDGEGGQFACLKAKSKRHSETDLEEVVEIIKAKYPNHLFLKTQQLVPVILEAADGALTKNALVKAILEITETARFEEIELPEELSEHLKMAENEELVARRQENYLRRIWDEIKMFPANQRKVLLLSLKESRRTEAITLLLKKRVATIKEIADALEIGLEEFSTLFERLPMTSQEIAEFLGIEDGEKTSKEQKVDNLRSIARNLLRRRLGIRK